jgi:hypothetical protein
MAENEKLSSEALNRISEALRRSNDREFEDMNEPIKRVYIDIEFLQDFRFRGRMLLLRGRHPR